MEIRALTRAEDGGNLLRQALRTLRYRWRNIAGSAYDAEAASTRPICRRMIANVCAGRCGTALKRGRRGFGAPVRRRSARLGKPGCERA